MRKVYRSRNVIVDFIRGIKDYGQIAIVIVSCSCGGCVGARGGDGGSAGGSGVAELVFPLLSW